MLVKRLEIYGFKSFAQKVKIEFSSGITAIVGPNGSGKSNIADAIRWVLGEQSLRSLRGNRLEDVIFAGSGKMKQLGLAEVCLTLDNSDGLLDIGFDEVTITRRVYRSGESEFYINKTPCRLKDIQDMLMDTGVGKDGYSIISQGKVEEILTAKHDERRQLFEEVAGIVKYKNRKREAEQKLEETEQNILRLLDITDEIKNQLEPLKQQAEKARRFLELSTELQHVETAYWVGQIRDLQQNLIKIDEELDSLTVQLSEAQERIAHSSGDIQQKTGLIDEIDAEIYQNQKELSETVVALEKVNNSLENLEREKARIIKTNEDESLKTNELASLEDSLTGKLIETQERLSSLRTSLEQCRNELLEKNKKVSDIDETINTSEKRIENQKSDIIDILNKISSKKNDLNSMNMLKTTIEKQQGQLLEEIDNTNTLLKETGAALESSIINDINGKVINNTKKLERLKDQKSVTAQEISSLETEMNNLLKLRNEAHARLNILVEMEKNYEGMHKGTKEIIETLEALPGLKSGYCGIVAQLLETPKNLETAVETALGGALQHIVTENDRIAQEMVEVIKKRGLGRATFLPLNTIRPRYIDKSYIKLLSSPDVVGAAVELVSYDEKYDNIFKNLLGQVLITRDLKSAVLLAKASGFRYRIVTLGGDMVNPGGSITGGSRVKANFILRRSRQINELKKEIGITEAKLKSTETSLKECRDRLAFLEAEIETDFEALRQDEIKLLSERKNIEQLELKHQELSVKKERITAESEQLKREEQEITERIRCLIDEIKSLERYLENIKTQVEKHQGSFNDEKLEKQRLTARITDLRVSMAALQQEEANICENIKLIQERISEVKAQKEHASKTLEANRNLLKNIDLETLEKARHKIEIEAKIKLLNEQLGSYQNRKTCLKAETDELNRAITQMNDTVSKLQNRIHSLEMRQTRYSLEIQNIESKLWETYRIDRRQLATFETGITSYKHAQEEIAQLKQAISSLGPVNPRAVDEYAKTKERYDFLIKQIKDLEDARESLRKVINKMVVKMEEQFVEKFNVLSQSFNKVFGEMFNGGKASVSLENPESPLDSNIEILAQPPGKKLQNLLMLSGGEKALTAIALLFAILRVKPTPFCVLDEIEAALDDVNVDRFAHYLQRYAEKSQFIIITHRRGTMEVAKTLYGVTMEDTATSKMVAVQLKDATA